VLRIAHQSKFEVNTKIVRQLIQMSVILLTNVNQYAGPGALEAMLRDGQTVVCHDPSFVEKEVRNTFEKSHVSVRALAAQVPGDIYEEVIKYGDVPDGIVLNDVYPITRSDIETISLNDLMSTFHAVVENPFRLTQLFLPAMKARQQGAFVFVTSAREMRPEPGFAVPTMLRAATTAFAKSVAKEGAPFGVQSNVVAPNYLYSEMYYPRSRFVDDPVGREFISRLVPFRRLGEPEEVGALISFLVSGKSPFTTGQVIYFTGGWP
jgi:3-oxoacyl-[acyl-carrier protein] reductase